MSRQFWLRTLTALVLGALGCNLLPLERSCPEALAAATARGVEASCKVLRRPGLLVEQAEAGLARRDLDGAYQYFALLHALHPDSAENREVFPLAARCFVESHFQHRTEPGSPWVSSEPPFMFGWLEQLFQGAEVFPRQQVEALFLGMHGGMFQDFLAYARSRPALSGWVIVARDDNGIIWSVSGERAERSKTSIW